MLFSARVQILTKLDEGQHVFATGFCLLHK